MFKTNQTEMRGTSGRSTAMVPKKHLWHDPVEATAATAILWDCQNLEPQ